MPMLRKMSLQLDKSYYVISCTKKKILNHPKERKKGKEKVKIFVELIPVYFTSN